MPGTATVLCPVWLQTLATVVLGGVAMTTWQPLMLHGTHFGVLAERFISGMNDCESLCRDCTKKDGSSNYYGNS